MAEQRPAYDGAWSRSPVARLGRAAIQAGVLVPLVRFLSPVHVIGRENIDNARLPAVFIANHQSHLDTPVVLAAVGRRIRSRLVVAAAADYFFKNRFGSVAVCLAFGAVPVVRRQGSSRESLEQIKQLLRLGWSVLIFPAGTRGERSGFKKGFAYLSVDTGTPVVPLCLYGLRDSLPKGSFVPLPAAVVIGAGPAIEPGTSYDDLVERASEAWGEVRAMVDSEIAGWGVSVPSDDDPPPASLG
jgi:1-acyl-sn-glycerol-3-phosphate acyltransferase